MFWNNVAEFLRSYHGKCYLEENYVRQKKSIQAIADEKGTSLVTVHRALKFHQIPRRDFTAAQRAAEQAGRHHSVKGRTHTEETKKQISDSMKQRKEQERGEKDGNQR